MVIILNRFPRISFRRSQHDCPLDLEDLLEANGMMTKEEASHVSTMERRRQRMMEQQRRRRDMREIVTDELFARGIAIKKLGMPERSELPPSKLFRQLPFLMMSISNGDFRCCRSSGKREIPSRTMHFI